MTVNNCLTDGLNTNLNSNTYYDCRKLFLTLQLCKENITLNHLHYSKAPGLSYQWNSISLLLTIYVEITMCNNISKMVKLHMTEHAYSS